MFLERSARKSVSSEIPASSMSTRMGMKGISTSSKTDIWFFSSNSFFNSGIRWRQISASAIAYGATSAMGTSAIDFCPRPLPISSFISIIWMPKRTQAKFFKPRLREDGSQSHSAIIVSNDKGSTINPFRARMVKSYLRLCPIFGILVSVRDSPSAWITSSRLSCGPPAYSGLCPIGR